MRTYPDFLIHIAPPFSQLVPICTGGFARKNPFADKVPRIDRGMDGRPASMTELGADAPEPGFPPPAAIHPLF